LTLNKSLNKKRKLAVFSEKSKHAGHDQSQ
jgi:hypothetical protein